MPTIVRQSLRLAAAALLLAGCALPAVDGPSVADTRHGAPDVTAAADAPLSVDVIRARLERAADGLLYTSESDYPFLWFHDAGPAPAPLTPDALLMAAHEAADEPVEVISLDDFFARHIERVDPYDSVAVALVPRYRHLRETIRLTVPGVRVFRVGRIQVRCYVVGSTASGEVVGLKTVAIET
jgi:hypothetical protein